MMRFRLIVYVVFFFFCGHLMSAQNQVSESEVNLQKLFLEAHQQKILGNLEEAIKLFKSIRKEDKSLGAASYELALLYEAQEAYTDAIKMGKEAIEKEPDNPWFKRALATILEKTGEYLEAAKLYGQLVDQNPNEVEFYMMQAFYLVKGQNIRDAIKVYDHLETKRGINEELSRRKYSLYLSLGDFKNAEAELTQLIDSDKKNIGYRIMLAEFYGRRGKKALSQGQYKEILKIDPENGQAQAALVEELNGTGSSVIEYANSLESLIARPNLSIDLKVEKMLPLIQQVIETEDPSLTKALLKLSTKLEEVHPNNAKAYSISGDLLFNNNQIEQAIEKYQKTLSLNETVYAVWEQLMYAHLKMGDYKTLVNVAENSMDLFPNKVKSYELYGIAATKLGETDEAIDLLNEALFMTGQDKRLKSQVQNALANAYWAAGQEQNARKQFELAVANNQQSAKVLNDYSRFLAETGAFEEALKMINQAQKLVPNTSGILATRGYIHYQEKEYQKALKSYESALAIGGEKDPVVLEEMGDVLFQLKEVDQAITYWKKALGNGSSSRVLKMKIEQRKIIE